MTGTTRQSWKISLFAAAWLAALLNVLLSAAGKAVDRTQLLPRLHNGDTLRYQCQARLHRYVKTKSNVATMFDLKPLEAKFSTDLKLSVQDFHTMDHRPMLAGQTQLLAGDSPVGQNTTAHPVNVSFVIGGDGAVAQADGLDNLDPELRLAWQFWISQFAFAWTFPAAGVKPGEKWKSLEIEKTPTPIAGLVWERENTYVQDEKCPILPDQQCAVILTTANLKQKSNPNDATPEDYKLQHLRTFGTAKGTNQSVAYISSRTGILLRATEDVQQSLDVTIATADGSNRVQYLVDVNSHFETFFTPPKSAPAP